MRLIDADALQERHCESCNCEVRECCKTDPICATMMWVNEESTFEPKQDWISVEDRLPEEGENVLIYTKTDITNYGMYTKRYGFSEREGFICGDGFMWVNTASHWMPLPTPPKK